MIVPATGKAFAVLFEELTRWDRQFVLHDPLEVAFQFDETYFFCP